MPSGKLTRSQKNFIEKLSENSPKRMEEVQHFLVEKGAGSLDELSVPDASALIEKLKSQSEPSGIAKMKKKSLDDLTSREASNLIERLKS